MSIYDRIAASRPADRNAAAVTAESRDNFTSIKQILRRHSDQRLKTRPPNQAERGSSSFEDLSGRLFGRFRVVGIFDGEGAPRGKQATMMWVCRCACGRYQTRTARAVRNPKNTGDCCDECQQLRYLRDTERKKALGLIEGVTVERAVIRLKASAGHNANQPKEPRHDRRCNPPQD